MGDHADAPKPQTPPSLADLYREIERLRLELEDSERSRERLKRENERLKRELDAARRAGKRQAAPFSKGAPQPQPRPPGRRRHGRHGHRRAPATIDETIDVPLPMDCPHCGGTVTETRVATQIQEDLPVVRRHVRCFHVHVGGCNRCGRRVQGRHPLQTTDALGAASTHLGPQAVALIALLNRHLGLSHGKVAALLRDWFGLRVQPSGVTHALCRPRARRRRPTRRCATRFARARSSVRMKPAGKSCAGSGGCGVFATARTVVYAIQDGRGFDEAAAVLGADFDGALVRDGWAPYRQFDQAAHQTCLAHLIRRCGEIADAHPRSAWPRHVKTLLQDALDVRDRVLAGEISARGAAVARGHLMSRLLDLLAAPGTVPDCQRLAAHLTTELPAVSGFLFDFTLEATDWPTATNPGCSRAEQALRPAVVNRKVSGGNRSERGAEAQEILSSIVQTARLRDLDPRDTYSWTSFDRLSRRFPRRSPRCNRRTPLTSYPRTTSSDRS